MGRKTLLEHVQAIHSPRLWDGFRLSYGIFSSFYGGF